MGLHSKTRYVIQPQGKDRTEQMRDIINRAVYLFDRVQPVYCPDEPVITRKYARHLSRFEAPNLEEDQIRKHFRIPQPGEAYEVYSVADVLGVINLELKTLLSATKVGMLLNKLGFKKVRNKKARGYMVRRYTIEEISNNRKGVMKDGEEQELPF